MNMLNTLDGVRDETGASMTPWAQWTRKWTAEENRHGDAMNKCASAGSLGPLVKTRAGAASAHADRLGRVAQSRSGVKSRRGWRFGAALLALFA